MRFWRVALFITSVPHIDCDLYPFLRVTLHECSVGP